MWEQERNEEREREGEGRLVITVSAMEALLFFSGGASIFQP